jgi:MFS family permease
MKLSASASPREVIVARLLGTFLEWYDCFLWGTASALVCNRPFFPNFDPLVGTLVAFATYAVGFRRVHCRPLGGLVFGHFGDRVGRKQVLIVTC